MLRTSPGKILIQLKFKLKHIYLVIVLIQIILPNAKWPVNCATGEQFERPIIESNKKSTKIDKSNLQPNELIDNIELLDSLGDRISGAFNQKKISGSPGNDEPETSTQLLMQSLAIVQGSDMREPSADPTNGDTETSDQTTATPTTLAPPSTTNRPTNCPDENYCLNGGTCILLDGGQMFCNCPDEFYGTRCQTRNICKTTILDSMTGDQLCAKIDRECYKNDKFFRCSCLEDEYFIFKQLTNQTATQASNQPMKGREANAPAPGAILDRENASNLPPGENVESISGRKNLDKIKSNFYKTRHESFKYNNKDPSAHYDNVEEEDRRKEFFKTKSNSANSAELRTNIDPKSLVDQQQQQQQPNQQSKASNYIVECRKIDKCLGVRCKQLSEICQDGQCVCNQDSGYIQDPKNPSQCKLLNPCKLPIGDDDKPICGQARCVPTYDQELYKCICPLGYQALRVGSYKNSTVCTILRNLICKVPLLNKCQHICEVDNASNNYKCSCLRGYRPGSRPGIDDHMCFFIEQVDQIGTNDISDDYLDQQQGSDPYRYGRESTNSKRNEYIYKPFKVTRQQSSKKPHSSDQKVVFGDTIDYDSLTPPTQMQPKTPRDNSNYNNASAGVLPDLDLNGESTIQGDSEEAIPARLKSDEIIIKQVLRSNSSGRDSFNNGTMLSDEEVGSIGNLNQQATGNLNKLTAQERCNMYCEENKICELEQDSTDSYRCICNRQGYVSVGDRCLDWCAAADFEWQLRGLLDYTCWSGVCKPTDEHPALSFNGKLDEMDEKKQLDRESSWRPTFECDCSNSPLLIKDSETKLCKFNFKAALDPCKPGNVGYIDCVEHKNAYCSVLYKPHKQFISEHQRERFFKKTKMPGSGVVSELSKLTGPHSAASSSSSTIKLASLNQNKIPEKLYTCVCSPEKKFLVDKPRNKERCVDECDLLNVECGRFNRMCRPATISSDDFGRRNLVLKSPDEARLNFKRTGCECLPGFNVGPSESVDFTIDNNNDNVNQPNSDMSSGFNYEDGQLSINMNDANNDFSTLPEYSASNRAKYMNINSRCLLDYDVVEFHASFKAPVDFNPTWLKIRNLILKNSFTQKSSNLASLGGRVDKQDLETTLTDLNQSLVNNKSSIPIGSVPLSKADQDFGQSSSDDDLSVLEIPDYMREDISGLHKSIVLVAQCDPALMPISIEAFEECTRYRYWIVQKLRNHFVDWRKVITEHLQQTFDLMEGNIRLRVNKCEATLKSVSSPTNDPDPRINSASRHSSDSQQTQQPSQSRRQPSKVSSKKDSPSLKYLDPLDQDAIVDADIHCELTLHSASDETSPRYARKVLLEKQLQKFIFNKESLLTEIDNRISSDNDNGISNSGKEYYLMAPNMLIRRESFDQLAKHRKEFNPCKSDYAYCEKQTRCDMVDTVNFTCTCEYGYTPIGSRDIYFADSRKEVCEDINECLFDVCKELANVSTCINEIGDYRCQCNRHYVGDNKRYCKHVCSTISCKYGKCRLVDDHHAFCECDEGYKETDCSVQDPNVALRKANMIICGSIFTSVLLLAITLAISLNSQLKKTKKKLKQLEMANQTVGLYEFSSQQRPFLRTRPSKVSVGS